MSLALPDTQSCTVKQSTRVDQMAATQNQDCRGGDLRVHFTGQSEETHLTCIFLTSVEWPAFIGSTMYFMPLAWARGKGEGGGKRAFFPFLSGTLLGLVFFLSLCFEGFWLLEKKVDQDTLIFCFLPSPGSEPGVLQ